MQLDQIIQTIIRHNALIIEVLIGLIVLFVLFLSYRTFLSARQAEKGGASAAGGGISGSELEETLKQLLAKANALPSAEAVAGEGGEKAEAAAPLLAEIEELKKKLETKQTEIETLKSRPAQDEKAGGGGAGAEDRSKLEAQLKELQGKLAEYEIISEDIADLSFYKEENARLQKELEAAKGVGAATVAVAAAAAVAPEAPAVQAAEPPAPAPAEAVVEVAEEAAAAPAAPEEPLPEVVLEAAPAAPSVNDDDLMKEFASAIEEQSQKAPVAEAAPQPEADDALSAFEAAVVGTEPASADAEEAPGSLDLAGVDLEKMVSEAQDLGSVQDMEEAVNSLEASPNAEKLAEEAASMEEVRPEDAQLMGDFEKFVKKGG